MISIEYLRQFRIAGYAIFDFVVSFIGVYLLAPLLSKLFAVVGIIIPKNNWLFLTLPASILVHLAVGNITKMTADFMNPGQYPLKILIFVLLVLGLRGVKFSWKF